MRALVAALVLAVSLGGCASSAAPGSAVVSKAPKQLGSDQILPFVHIDGFGTPTDSAAWIAWEFEAQAYVKYQIAYTSCTCRQESINVRSLLYVEVTKQGAASRIKRLMFNYWGDSPKMPAGNTREEIETGFMKLLPGQSLETLDDVDVVAGATVTTVNLKQINAALLAYHLKSYPQDSGIAVDIDVDAVTSATVE